MVSIFRVVVGGGGWWCVVAWFIIAPIKSVKSLYFSISFFISISVSVKIILLERNSIFFM